jgi:hypothetical protein
MNSEIIKWLLNGDVSIQYQVHKDVLGNENPGLRKRIEKEGYGKTFLSMQLPNGHCGKGFYQPKWTSTHYTLLDLKNLSISPGNTKIRASIKSILKNEKDSDGGINPGKTISCSDVCINGMVLNYACYFQMREKELESIVDFLLSQQLKDGGFNCYSNRRGAIHSSMHTTISVSEGFREYHANSYTYRLEELLKAEKGCCEFLLQHKLFKSDKSGEVIKNRFTMLSYPSRWYYDILRALDYFRSANVRYDNRMEDAIEVLMNKRKKNGSWDLQAKHPGQTHFDMETTGKPSRWNTLRALRVLKHYGIDTGS